MDVLTGLHCAQEAMNPRWCLKRHRRAPFLVFPIFGLFFGATDETSPSLNTDLDVN